MHGHIDLARVLTLTATSAFLRKWNAFDSPVSAPLETGILFKSLRNIENRLHSEDTKTSRGTMTTSSKLELLFVKFFNQNSLLEVKPNSLERCV